MKLPDIDAQRWNGNEPLLQYGILKPGHLAVPASTVSYSRFCLIEEQWDSQCFTVYNHVDVSAFQEQDAVHDTKDGIVAKVSDGRVAADDTNAQ